MNNSTLQLYPEPSAEAANQQFSLIGIIDVNAIAILEKLYVLPENCVVELDFAMVQRVNSMGLAQLLKLFEHWEKHALSISVVNTNRMTTVLFKMTGLNRFLTGEQTASSSASPPTVLNQPQYESASVTLETARMPVFTAQMLPFSSKKIADRRDGKLKLWVNAQNNQQINGWYFFNTYLQRHLGREVQMELVQGAISAKGEPIEQMDIVFTTPFMASHLALTYGFHPLVRPIDQTDEVTLLARADDLRQKPSDFCNAKVVTTAADNFVYLLGRFLLEEVGATASYSFSGHDIKALQLLLKGNADLLFISSDTYQALASMTKKMLRKIEQSETGFAFYLFCLAPHQLELSLALSDVLLKMNQDSQGRQVLKDLGIDGWSAPKPDEIYMMELLFKRYAHTTTTPSNQNALAAHAHC